MRLRQRQGRIDPNPHQIDAVIFVLKRIPEGGCILADEVGLGKPIEASSSLSCARRGRLRVFCWWFLSRCWDNGRTSCTASSASRPSKGV
jgi:hypothetical protein